MASLSESQKRDFTPEQVKALYPSDLSLKYVQIFFRHGERTPFRHRFPEAGIPRYWDLCKAADEFRGVVYYPIGDFHLLHYRQKLEEPLDNGRLERIDQNGKGFCLFGELTDQGRLSTIALGQRIRKLYVEQLGFLPPTLEDENVLYIRTTKISRTIESMIQVFAGMYPQSPRAIPNFHTRTKIDENLYSNYYYCDRMRELTKIYSAKAAEEWDPKLQAASKLLEKWIPNGISVRGDLNPVEILDTIHASLGNGISLPSELTDPNLMRTIEGAAVAQSFNGYMENAIYQRLGVGSLLGDVLDRFGFVRMTPTTQKMALYGSHDATIGSILATFGVFDNRWPCFASNITFELFKAQNGGLLSFFKRDRYYVRMRYNQDVLKLPSCKEVGKHREGDESLCTWEAFSEAVQKIRPADLRRECARRRTMTA